MRDDGHVPEQSLSPGHRASYIRLMRFDARRRHEMVGDVRPIGPPAAVEPVSDHAPQRQLPPPTKVPERGGARPTLTAILLVVLPVVLLWSIGCESKSAPATREDRPEVAAAGERHVDNVVLISIDSLRADHLGVYGYQRPTSPALDALAARGLVFDRAYSTTSWTLPSHTAMLTGLDDRAHRVRDQTKRLAPDITTLAEDLADKGIHTVGFYSGPYLHPTFGLGRGFEEYWNCSSVVPKNPEQKVGLTHFASFKDVTNPLILANLSKWLQSGDRKHRNFIFIHMWDVHYAYTPPQRYADMFDADYTGSVNGTVYGNDAINAAMDSRDLQHLIALYDGEIRYTDDTVDAILDRLEEAGILANAAVIVVADHGEEFFEHGSKGHQATLFEEVLKVPMILTVSGRAPKVARVDNVVSLIDVYPTVCALLGASCTGGGPKADSLVGLYDDGPIAPTRNDALANLTISSMRYDHDALVTKDGKVLRWSGGMSLPLIERVLPDQPIPEQSKGDRWGAIFFDQEQLPAERSGSFLGPTPGADITGRTLSRLEGRVSEADQLGEKLAVDAADGDPPQLDEETVQRLRALGYME